MTALSIVQDATARLFLTVPNQVFTSNDAQTVQMRSLLNALGKEILREFPWQALRIEGSITTVATLQQSALPADFGYIVNDSMWNRTLNRQIAGPLSPQEWQREQAGPVVTSVEFAFRIMGNYFYITPTPTAGQSVYYEYVSKYWATDSTGATPKIAMTADADLSLLDEELLTLGIMWRFLSAKGMDYSQPFADFQTRLKSLMGHDGGKPTLSLHRPQPIRLAMPNIPDGTFGT